MNAIENITKQITAIIMYQATDNEQLEKEYEAFRCRIREGIKRMEEAGVFSENEIKEVEQFGSEYNGESYREKRQEIYLQKRNEFQF